MAQTIIARARIVRRPPRDYLIYSLVDHAVGVHGCVEIKHIVLAVSGLHRNRAKMKFARNNKDRHSRTNKTIVAPTFGNCRP